MSDSWRLVMEPEDDFLYKYKGIYFVNGLSSPEGIDLLDSLEIRDDDIFIITYPKSGTIWTQNIVSLILHEGHRDETENITLIDRAPWLEYNILNVDFPSCPSPRLFSSHLPYYLVPKGLRSRRAKIIYVLRNPKDVMVSNYYFHKLSVKVETPKDFSTFFEKFLAGKVFCSSWLDHVEGWYAHKGDFNILFLSYEEMKKDNDPKHTSKSTTEWLKKKRLKVLQWPKVQTSTRLKWCGGTSESCTIGDWKSTMTVAQNEKFDRVFKDRIEKLPFRFCWDIQEDPEPISSSAEENNV
ncbi:amine sulfotransferase-like [Protobothrops mucrosquamatus]|uniref:amine sulfotransferase-like n=1 Tax=Protobothrops mucrosquamatus TaxID=103944 RepID=UPI000775647A|nr:amine sulfotransferase-like [Protobothrops mucrosquamatus]